jgi:hypothetical protein
VCALLNTCNQFKEFLRGLFVPATLYEDIKDVVVLIHRTPQIMALTVNGQKYFIQAPFVARARAPATQLIGIVLPKFRHYWRIAS